MLKILTDMQIKHKKAVIIFCKTKTKVIINMISYFKIPFQAYAGKNEFSLNYAQAMSYFDVEMVHDLRESGMLLVSE
jgi:hypothetical protein